MEVLGKAARRKESMAQPFLSVSIQKYMRSVATKRHGILYVGELYMDIHVTVNLNDSRTTILVTIF